MNAAEKTDKQTNKQTPKPVQGWRDSCFDANSWFQLRPQSEWRMTSKLKTQRVTSDGVNYSWSQWACIIARRKVQLHFPQVLTIREEKRRIRKKSTSVKNRWSGSLLSVGGKDMIILLWLFCFLNNNSPKRWREVSAWLDARLIRTDWSFLFFLCETFCSKCLAAAVRNKPNVLFIMWLFLCAINEEK